MFRSILVFASLVAFPVVAQQPAVTRQPIPPRATYAIRNVNVIPMDSNRVVANQTVVVSDGKITAMGGSNTAIPANALVIDGSGKFLMPGLAEMHSHVPSPEGVLSNNVLFLYVANGITLIRGMQGSPYHLALRQQIASGEVLGPRFFAAGPQLSPRSVPNADSARAVVQRQKEQGFDLLKIQEGLSRSAYDAIVTAAKERRIPFGGHVPDSVGLWRAIEAGQVTIDHVDNYMDAIVAADFPQAVLDLVPASRVSDPTARRIAAAAEYTKRAGAAIVPTMALWEMLYVTPDSATIARTMADELRFERPFTVSSYFVTAGRGGRVPREQYNTWVATRNRILKALSDAGVTILLGTDSPQLFSIPGYSIHREMRVMAQAGMTPWQILRSGTYNVAAHLGLLAESGTVAVGKRADLILLDANPLLDVSNVQKRAGVLVDGRWLPQAEIQKRLDAIAAGYAAQR